MYYMRGLRAERPLEARHHCPHGAALQASARLSSNGGEQKRDLRWIGDDLAVAEEGEIALFVGCLPQFDAVFERELGLRTVEIARSAIRILNRLGIEPVVAQDERCCGHDLLWDGDDETFQALAVANAKTFQDRGVKRILTTCAECCRTWRLDYADATPDYRPQIQHLSEYLAEQMKEEALPLESAPTGGVTFHDPCRLSRHMDVVDAPRTVLAAIPDIELAEMTQHGHDAVCCGTSGFIHCDAVSRHLQTDRLASAAETGAETLLTACPKCLIHFECAQYEDRRKTSDGPTIAVQDLTVYLAGRLSAEEPAVADKVAENQTGGTS